MLLDFLLVSIPDVCRYQTEFVAEYMHIVFRVDEVSAACVSV